MRSLPQSPRPGSDGGLARWFVENPGAGWAALLAVLVWGIVSFRSLPQQEDPALPGRLARVICVWPGASADQIEEWVARPLETRIAQLDSMRDISSESRDSVCVLTLGQRPARPAVIKQEWDTLRASLDQADLPDGCQPPRLQTEFGDVVTLLLAVTTRGDDGYPALARAARRLQETVRQIPQVGRVQLIGEVGESIELTATPEALAARGLSLRQLREGIAGVGRPLPGARVERDDRLIPVQLDAFPATEDAIRSLIIGQSRDGSPLRLDQAVTIRRIDAAPPPLTADVLRRDAEDRLTASRSVLVAIEMRGGQVIRDFDREVRAAVERLRKELPGTVEIITVSDQPASVAARLDRFGRCFVEAVAVILALSLILMEWRAALVVAGAIPLTLALTFAGMAVAGIPLHQVSIAALIIALGMLVDDPVVAADGINREMAAGVPRPTAAWLGPWKLRRPILYATVINIFAFLPLLLLPGDKGAFIHALPVVVSLSLACSRLVSMTFVPLLGRRLLRGQAGFEQTAARRPFPFGTVDRWLAFLLRPYRWLLESGLRHPLACLILAYALLAASLALVPRLGRQFFPPAERNQLLVDVTLPEPASPARTRAVCDEVRNVLGSHREIVAGAVFVGGSAPRFYYNLTPKAPADHLAQFVLATRHEDEVPALAARLQAALDRDITAARCVVRRLEQGPPVEAPIQIRLTGPDRSALGDLARQVRSALTHAGASKVNDTLGTMVTGSTIRLDPARAASAGVTPGSLVSAIQAAGPGLVVASLREQGITVPVTFRLVASDGRSAPALESIPLETTAGPGVPLREVAEVDTTARPASLHRQGGLPSVTVEALAAEGELPSEALSRARPQLDALALPAGCRLSFEGEARELEESRREMGIVMAVSLGLIGLSLIAQFRSVGRAAVVMLTVPLGLIGALVGLSVAQVPLGFMAMLAAVSLAGVIVSHIIVLSDAVEEARAGGSPLREALITAGMSRLRPVLVTTLATAGGLVPLAIAGGALWRPLAAVHIAGLLIATALTLVVLPVWYSVVIRTGPRP